MENIKLKLWQVGEIECLCCFSAPIGHVSGGNVAIRAPFVQPTGGPISLRLPGTSNPGTFNIQPGMQASQAVQGIFNYYRAE
jgi:hypothetical protein